MKTDITAKMVDEHRLILKMLAILDDRLNRVARGEFDDYTFFLTAVDFIRNYADRFHHAKEEDVLFRALVANGMPEKNSPIEAMLIEHDRGRAFVKAMETAAQKALAGEGGQNLIIAANGKGYVEMLREHIEKEDDILYPLAERVLPEQGRDAIAAAYVEAEARMTGLEEKYRKLVEELQAA